MKNFFKFIIVFVFIFGFRAANANTLIDSLNSAFLKNPKLNAERANMRAAREEKREAVSEFLPSITIEGYVSEQENTNPGDDTNFRPSEQSITVEQKIFQGGQGIASFGKKKHGQVLGQHKLKKIEQEILLDAAKAHTDLLLNKKKVNINLMNIDLLERQVETDQNRLEKGEINLTDLAQSESSLAGARAKLIAAQNDLVTSKSTFEKIIGKKPSKNIEEVENISLSLPERFTSLTPLEPRLVSLILLTGQRTAWPLLVIINISLSLSTHIAPTIQSVFIAVTPCPPRFRGVVSSKESSSTLPPLGRKALNFVRIPSPF